MRFEPLPLGIHPGTARASMGTGLVHIEEARLLTHRREAKVGILCRVDVDAIPEGGGVETDDHALARDRAHPIRPKLIALEPDRAGRLVGAQAFGPEQPEPLLSLGRLADRPGRVAFVKDLGEAAAPGVEPLVSSPFIRGLNAFFSPSGLRVVLGVRGA